MSVRTELVKEFLVGAIHERVVARYSDPLTPEVETALAQTDPVAVHGSSGDRDAALAARVARAGYLARLAETEMFERAREPCLLFAANLRTAASRDPGTERARLSADAARVEPTERPDPGDGRAFSWQVPGPGGHVRHYVAMEATSWLRGGDADHDQEGFKRVWLYGFFLRCCEEAEAALTA